MYDHKQIESKWQKYWEDNNIFKVENNSSKEPFYVLDMFPYPSGAWLHVGHPEGMTANDIVARYKTAKGYNVLHPMGWDAFGLPAENYAIKTGTHPRITTDQNIANFKKQIKALGFGYDWDREIDTTDPDYYKWTQWIFLKLFEKGLAYEQNLPINYCPSCKTGLANEEVLNDFTCERCGTKVEKKKIRQWVLAITKYADRLLNDVDKLDWPESIKEMQRNWIGKSEGCEFELKKSDDDSKSIRVYTTRIDTVFGMTYAVLAPDHPHVADFITSENKTVCEDYITEASKKSDQDRTQDDKQKTGVFTGSYVINPFNGQQVPLWIADYVLGNYGTGAVMAVPAHDTRDFAFAKQYSLRIQPVIAEYNILTWDSAPRDDFPTRIKKCSTAIVKHPNEDKYLVQNYSNGELCFTGGWIEWDETPLECMKRELQEESGIHNIKKSDFLGIMVWHGYKDRKQTNCKDPDYIYYMEVQDLDWFQESAVEWLEYKNVWLTKQELLENKSFKSHHKKMFMDFLGGQKAFVDLWILMDSWDFSGLESKEAQEKLVEFAESEWFGEKKVNFKLRDWLFSRQRYWGEPIPLVHCEECGIVGEKEENLPILLPDTDNFEPSGDGTSPLSSIEEFVNCECPKCGWPGKRETNTMPQWWGSCWYYLRYMDPNNSDALVDSEVEKYWGQVDSYVGGAEHAVLHLLYARFWHKFLFDINVVSSDEPFYRLRNQGLILAYSFEDAKWKLIPTDEVVDSEWNIADQDNLDQNAKYFEKTTGEQLKIVVAKMSKSLKNVVNPDKIVQQYGADSLRLYEMYMADFKDTAPWDTKNITWVRRFLEKSERLFTPEAKITSESDEFTMKLVHKTIKKIEEDIENYKFNTAIAQMMILVNNGLPKDVKLQREWRSVFVRILNPFAPHLAEELWERMNKASVDCVALQSWPEFDEAMTVDNTVTIWVQVLWKLRGEIEISKDEDKDSVLEKARTNENVAKFIEGKDLVKEIYVPGKIVNLVVK